MRIYREFWELFVSSVPLYNNKKKFPKYNFT